MLPHSWLVDRTADYMLQSGAVPRCAALWLSRRKFGLAKLFAVLSLSYMCWGVVSCALLRRVCVCEPLALQYNCLGVRGQLDKLIALSLALLRLAVAVSEVSWAAVLVGWSTQGPVLFFGIWICVTART